MSFWARWRPGPFVALLVAVALLVIIRVTSDFHPNEIDLSNALAAPSREHLLGTDQLGRDLLTRVAAGGLTSLTASVSVVIIALTAGSLIGFTAGFSGGKVDAVITRALDLLIAFPGLLLALLLIAIVGPGLATAIIAIGLSEIPFIGRVARAESLKERTRPYVDSARLMGKSSFHIITREVGPNSINGVIVQTSLVAADAILILAGLGYLGLGAQPPQAEWGQMIADGQLLMSEQPLIAIAPGLSIFAMALIFHAIAERLRTGGNRRNPDPLEVDLVESDNGRG